MKFLGFMRRAALSMKRQKNKQRKDIYDVVERNKGYLRANLGYCKVKDTYHFQRNIGKKYMKKIYFVLDRKLRIRYSEITSRGKEQRDDDSFENCDVCIYYHVCEYDNCCLPLC